MQPELVEAVAHEQRDPLGHEAPARVVLVHPVPDERRLERPALHAAEADLARRTRPSRQEQAEPVRGVEVALAVPRAAPGAERVEIGDGIGAPRLGQRLPRLEPVAAALPHGPPRGMVGAAQRPQEHPWSRQDGSLVTHGG